MANKKKIINDPVFGFITIPGELLYDLLQHPLVHRLTRIKQLGLTSYVYPGTQHTRFQHSLGALHLMTEAIKTLQSKGNEITPQEADAVYAAILLHDLGHGPFSHTLEDFFFSQHSHEDVGLALLERLNHDFNGKLSLTLQIVRGTYQKKFLHELVSGQLDMDRLDYLRRDSFFSGVTEGNIGSARIIKMLNIKNDKLVVEAKGIYSIENFLMSRRLMYWQVYLHKTAYAAEIMLHKTLQRARYVAQQDSSLFASPSLLYFLRQPASEITDEALDHFINLDDSDIWVALKAWCHHPDKVLSLLSNGIVNRKIFKVEVSHDPFPETYTHTICANLQHQLQLSEQETNYLVSCKRVTNNLYKKDDTAIDILFGDGTTKSITQASDMFDIDVLSKQIYKYYYCYYRNEE
ncbi:MAG: HD domain-containing protein [Paludibacteraceae bacterium]|nr:HD domain-containing protein [Paludibacteraceae bacterium]